MKHSAKRFITGVFILTLLVTGASATSFPDVDETAAYAEAVEFVNERGIMEGKNGGNFDPEGIVTRAEMAAIICRILHENTLDDSTQVFQDVPVGHWANGYVAKAAALGIVKGYPNGNFGPNDTVTYEQAVTMIVRAFDLEEYSLELGGYPDGYLAAASEFSFLNNLNKSIGNLMDRSSVAILIYNCYHS